MSKEVGRRVAQIFPKRFRPQHQNTRILFSIPIQRQRPTSNQRDRQVCHRHLNSPHNTTFSNRRRIPTTYTIQQPNTVKQGNNYYHLLRAKVQTRPTKRRTTPTRGNYPIRPKKLYLSSLQRISRSGCTRNRLPGQTTSPLPQLPTKATFRRGSA